MFKYTPPWMVMCQTMDQGNNKKLQVSGIPVKESEEKATGIEQQRSSSEESLQSERHLEEELPGTAEDDKASGKGWHKSDFWVSREGGAQNPAETEDCQKEKKLPKLLEDDLVFCEEVLKEETVASETPTYTPAQVDLLLEEPLIPMERSNGSLYTSPPRVMGQKIGPYDLIDLSPSCIKSENPRNESFDKHKVTLVNVDGDGHPALENSFVLDTSPGTLIDLRPSVSVMPMSPINSGDGEDVIIQAKKVAVAPDEHLGTSRGFFATKADGREVWIPSPDRDSKLATIRKENNHDLRAYELENKPTKLFTADEEEKYQVKGAAKVLENAELLELDRRKLIKSQVVKRNSAMADRWGSVEQLDWEEKPALVRLDDFLQKPDQDVRSSPLPFSAEPAAADAERVDTVQINFNVARQQFLRMEKTHQSSPPQSPRLFSPSYRASTSSFRFSEVPKPLPSKEDQRLETSPGSVVKAVKVNYNPSEVRKDLTKASVSDRAFPATSLESNHSRKLSHTRPNLTMSSSIDDLDSGLGEMSTDCGLGYSSDGGASNEILTADADVFEPPEQKSGETPIEKEIRLMMEREESLRRERGIKSVSSEEMVEIKSKPLLRQLPPVSPFSKGKDKNRMVFFVQREIEKESKREEDLRQEGKVKGMYDKGTPKELDERKKIFEQQVDDVPVMPQKRRSMLVSFASQESLDMDLILEESRGSASESGPVLASSTANLKMVIKESPEYGLHSTRPSQSEARKPNEANKANNASRGNDPRGNKQVETISREVGSESPGDPCAVRPLKHRTAFLIDREIEEEQRREEELQTLRQKYQSAKNSFTNNLDHHPLPPNLYASKSASVSSESHVPELPALTRQTSRPGAPDSKRGTWGDEERRGKVQEKKEETSVSVLAFFLFVCLFVFCTQSKRRDKAPRGKDLSSICRLCFNVCCSLPKTFWRWRILP
uniref:Uncharacterized protein n=2 Tax=Callorhinchus milii TaxID=7868 RepID=A0A4W3KCX7_CALMI